jgi:hypothetical protein
MRTVPEDSLHMTSWVSYGSTCIYILDLKRDPSVLHNFVLQTAHIPMPAPKGAGLRCVWTSMMHTWAMFVPYRRIAESQTSETDLGRPRIAAIHHTRDGHALRWPNLL